MPGPIKFTFGVYASHDEYMNPNLVGATYMTIISHYRQLRKFLLRNNHISLMRAINRDYMISPCSMEPLRGVRLFEDGN